ncbi:bifunctional acetate--CoA ligase family protein/GNAT family N-acetyltransferase [Rhodobacteraceae bacterium DSL-40]|uniref:bifunctional acetate--CoA ligase family protein/GNAT family N-acetyltransferase n=1 Tax=Amaricoccus sp. B4 TaxID=3368557 RepID=UPI000DACED1D
MTVRNLDKVLHPESVVVVGSGDIADTYGAMVMGNILEGGFEGPVWSVDPGRATFVGKDCFARVADLPAVPDLAVVAVVPEDVPGVIADLGAKGCRIAVVLTPGVKAEGGLRQRMLDAAKPYLLRIIGPDTLGVIAPAAKLNASVAHRAPRPGKLALLSQSAAIATTLIDWAEDREIGFSHIVSMGDMADVDMSDYLDLLSSDRDTRAVLMYLAHVKSARKFLSAARALARMKPVIAIKAGRTPQAAQAAATHTGAMAAEDAVMDAALRRAGVLRVKGLSEMFAAAETVARFRPLDRARLAIVTNGGGAGVLAVDRLMEGSGVLADLAPETLERLDGFLPDAWSHANPVDILGDANSARFEAAIDAVAADRNVDVVMVLNCPSIFGGSDEIAEAVAGKTRRSMIGRKPVLTCWLGGATARSGSRILRRNEIATYNTPASAAAAVGHLTDWGRAQAALLRVPDRAVEEALRATPHDAAAKARAIFAAVAAEGRSVLTEPEAKAAIAAYGVPVPDVRVATSVEEAGVLAGELLETTERVVIKLVSRQILHKTDVGGVVLNIETARQAEEAARAIAERVQHAGIRDQVIGFSVEPMIFRPGAQEVILGVSIDRVFGPTILFGAGGIDVEVMRDTAVALPPLDASLAADLVSRTRMGKVLNGYRGRPPADAVALQGAIVALSHMVEDFPCLRAVDINPILAGTDGVIALDAAIEIDPARVAQTGPNPALAIRPYPFELRREVVLKGETYVFRAVRPADALLYPDFLANVSPEDIRMRFMAPRAHFPEEMALKFTQLDYDRDMAFVAIAPDGTLAGVSRLASEPDLKHAEYALLVRSDLKGRGLGSTLMRHLIDYARSAGVESLDGVILAENHGMLHLVERLGFVNRHDPDEAGVMVSRLKL